MTLGQKLAGYRKLSGVTQQQLGEHLNISAQAISKWEKDMSEPALATLRALADFYKVSVDEILDLDSGFSDFGANANEEKEENAEPEIQEEKAVTIIGFCKNCGITVNEENIGAKEPVVLCNFCYEKEQRRKQLEKEAEQRRKEEEQRRKEYEISCNRKKIRTRRIWSLSVAGVVCAAFVAFMISNMISSFSAGKIFFTLFGSYAVFSFVSCLFYECFVTDVIVDWFCKTIRFPGLIFTFDIDGFLWLISMKILFWVLGLAFAILVSIIGITLGFICAPFVFPYVMVREQRKFVSGILDSE